MNTETTVISTEEIHKEIDLIQSCITRMSQNSFIIKGWFISVYAVVLALLPEKIDMFLLCIALIAADLIFWYMDAFFVYNEKVYRKMYDWVLEVRPQNNRELLYQLDPVKFKGVIGETGSVWKIMRLKRLNFFYVIPLIFVLIIFAYNYLPGLF